MAVTIESVPSWLILSGVGHALHSVKSGWYYTVCGTITPGGEQVGQTPPRVCRRCRAALGEPGTSLMKESTRA